MDVEVRLSRSVRIVSLLLDSNTLGALGLENVVAVAATKVTCTFKVSLAQK
jgi:hypothetical protein